MDTGAPNDRSIDRWFGYLMRVTTLCSDVAALTTSVRDYYEWHYCSRKDERRSRIASSSSRSRDSHHSKNIIIV